MCGSEQARESFLPILIAIVISADMEMFKLACLHGDVEKVAYLVLQEHKCMQLFPSRVSFLKKC